MKDTYIIEKSKLNKPNISVIVPVYNMSEYLGQCIESILCQTLTNIEVICIDDGSTDGSLDILSKYADCDDRIKTITQINQGVAISRNKGINMARGSYLCFADPDDYYDDKTVLEKLYNAVIKSGKMVAGGSFGDIYNGVKTDCFDGNLYGYTFEKEEIVKYADYQFDYGFHRFIFNTDFIRSNHIYFPEYRRFQDPPFLVTALHHANEFVSIPDIIYRYRLRDTVTNWTLDKIIDNLKGLYDNFKFALDNGYEKLYRLNFDRLIALMTEPLTEIENVNNSELKKIVYMLKGIIRKDYLGEEIKKFSLLDRFVSATEMITIVIPAYNVEKYIRQCLDSVINQTVIAHRIIVINDGSTDGTGNICEEYSVRYPGFITYISQDNKGLGATRNIGIDMVDTPYICFLDSDDWQPPRLVEFFIRLLEENQIEPDVIFTLPKCYNQASRLIEPWMDKHIFESIFMSDKDQICYTIDKYPEIYKLEVNANRKIYRTQFLKDGNYRFSEGVKWEDVSFHFAMLHDAKIISALPEAGFIYRTNCSGQITGGRGKGRLDIIPVFNETLSMCDSKCFSERDKAYVLHTICSFTTWFLDMTDSDNITELLEGLHLVFERLDQSVIDIFLSSVSNDAKLHSGLINFLRGKGYLQLADYRKRQDYYYEWRMKQPRKHGIIYGGIQCIRDSGIKYTLNLLIKKIKYDGF